MRCGGHQLASALKSNRVNGVIVRFIVIVLGVVRQRADMAALKRPVAELALTIKRGSQARAKATLAAAPPAHQDGVKLRFRAGGFAALRNQALDRLSV